ncbi:response regulator transcription factor [Comamonas odontotermitis]|uniref:response regulator transcription factor n=1 Tax=Comamonas odontotermitis TaxID=379895 RepID=UPI003752B5B3
MGVANSLSNHRYLIVEDDPLNAGFMADGLRQQGAQVCICNEGVRGLALAVGQEWDAIVLDRMLPGDFDGLKIVQALRAMGKQTPVLVLSALSSIDERVRGLKAGGDDYLSKPFAFSELVARIEALMRRSQTVEKPREMQVEDLRINLMTRSAERGGQTLALQPREFRLLAYLMQHAGQIVTRTMLLESVWDYHFDPQTNVIDVHISRLRAKVDKGHALALIHTVRGVGYCLTTDPRALMAQGL